jgi:hypothetical protein
VTTESSASCQAAIAALAYTFTSTGIMEIEIVAVITLHQDVVILQGLENHGGTLRHHKKEEKEERTRHWSNLVRVCSSRSFGVQHKVKK